MYNKEYQFTNSKKSYFLLVFLCSFLHLSSQIPSNPIGANPLYLKWHQISTDHFHIIYPESVDSQAVRMANVIDFISRQHDASIRKSTLTVPIILTAHSVRSNGFVTVGPFRSEIVTTPPQFDCTSDWTESVCTHEYRHIQQFSTATNGITKTVKTVLGSWAWGGMMALALPRWYYEGDAVIAETKYSFSGRGRLPVFLMEYKALFEAGKSFNYEKAGAGSLKEYVPNWYHLGYHMCSYGQQNFGEDLWRKVVEDATRYKGIIFPFSKSLKKHTGLSTKELYQKTVESLTRQYYSEIENRPLSPAQKFNNKKKATYTNYNNPIPIDQNTILAEKVGLDQLNSLYLMDARGEKKLTEHGIILDAPMSKLSYANGLICWSRLDFDWRRANKSFSNIMLYNLEENKSWPLTHKSYLFSPALSTDASQIVAVKINDDMSSNLVIIDAETGAIIQELRNITNAFYIHPCWTDDDQLVLILKKNQQHSLAIINPATQKIDTLVQPAYHQLSHPFYFENKVVYSSGETGVNNIFVVDINTKEIHQLSSAKLGAFQPAVSPDGKLLYFSDYSAEGFNIMKAKMDSLLWKPVKQKNNDKTRLTASQKFSSVARQLDSLSSKEYPIKKFKKWTNILNPHSLLPIIDPPTLGLEVLSDNSFSTMSATAGAYYNYNENEWEFLAGLNYAELFPVIHLNFVRSDRSALFLHFDALEDNTIEQTVFAESWFENRGSAGISLPLNLSRGNMINRLNIQGFYRFIDVNTEGRFNDPQFSERDTVAVEDVTLFEPLFTEILENESFHSIDLAASYTSVKRPTRQQIIPRMGYRVQLRFRDLLAENDFDGQVFLARGDLYLPGFMKNHGFLLNGMYQKEKLTDNYRFSDVFIYPRGYDISRRRDRFIKFGINYHFPLFYPDKSIGPFAFIKRLKANLFYDHGILKTDSFPFESNSDHMKSLGLELTLDFRALRLLEVDLGLRYSYAIDAEFAHDDKRHHFEFLLLRISDQ